MDPTNHDPAGRPPRCVVLFVLRRDRPQTVCRLDSGADGGWHPVVAPLLAGETEREGVRRLSRELPDARVYASGGPPLWLESGPANPFVAVLEAEAGAGVDEGFRWLPLAEAVVAFASPEVGAAASEVERRFVSRPPDEALRIF